MENAFICWNRLDVPGHDACRLQQVAGGWRLSGVALYQEKGELAALSYDVFHDGNWLTKTARISGWSGRRDIDLDIRRDAGGVWFCNDQQVDAVAGCLDIDLGFTPATNTNAIRRMKQAVGDAQKVMIAWIDTEDWQLKPLEQQYHLRADGIYDYGAPTQDFHSTLRVDDHGLVTDYAGLWRASA